MQEAEKSNVVQLQDYAQRRAAAVRRDTAAPCCSATESAQLMPWRRSQAAYPGGIDDLPI